MGGNGSFLHHKLQSPSQRGNKTTMMMSLLAELAMYFYDVIQDQIFMLSVLVCFFNELEHLHFIP